MPSPTTATYTGFQEAYDYFNDALFGGELPACMITLRHKRRTLGYFYPEKFKRRSEDVIEEEGGSVTVTPVTEEEAAVAEVEALFAGKKAPTVDQTCCEIALNATAFERGDRDVLSTLVHEMVHLWEHYFASPPAGGWHGRTWGRKMEEIGLIPSNTGQPGGKKLGKHMSHLIDDEGAFARAYATLADAGFKIEWGENPEADVVRKAYAKNKIKYACPDCGLAAWGKPQIRLFCADCSENEARNVILEAVI